MGQAKRRGSFEQRKAASIERHEAEAKARQERLAAEEAALTPEQRAKRRKAQQLLGTLAALSGMSLP